MEYTAKTMSSDRGGSSGFASIVPFGVVVSLLLLLAPVAAAAATWIEPTKIPFDHNERMALIAQFDQNLSHEERRLAVLTQIAVVAGEGKDRGAVDTVEKRLHEVIAEKADDPELMAARGALITYKASIIENDTGDTSFFLGKGNRIMDRAVMQAPHNLGARLQRGIATAHMPPFVGRAHTAVKDWHTIRSNLETGENTEFTAFIDYHYALALSKDGDAARARDVWQGVVNMSIDPWSMRAIEHLE